MLKMAELVHDDVLNAMHGSLNQIGVDRDPSLAAATSPSGLHLTQRNGCGGNAVPGGHFSAFFQIPPECFFSPCPVPVFNSSLCGGGIALVRHTDQQEPAF